MFETEIISIKDETWDVKTFRLKRPGKLDFKPGQYGLFSFPNKPKYKGESRPFTFSSSPTERDYIEITVKKMTDFTIELHKAKIGDGLNFAGPLGEDLVFDDKIKEDIVFIAGGSGITPFMSALRYAAAKKMPNLIILLFSNKTISDIIFRDELSRRVHDNKNLKVVHTITTDTCNTPKYECGRISKEIILKYVPSSDKKLFYICGPPPMIKSIKDFLKEIGIQKKKILIEDWQLPGKGQVSGSI